MRFFSCSNWISANSCADHDGVRRRLLALLMLLFTVQMGCGPQTVSPLPVASNTRTPAIPLKTAVKVAPISIAAASDLRFALNEIMGAFRLKYPDSDVDATFGASGSIYAQIANGAPFDMFLSADKSFPSKLIEQGFGISESEFGYARGHLVVWVKNESSLDLEQLKLNAVADASVKKVAIANPKTAPYGRAAEAALKHELLYEAVQDRLVLGENISQAAQFVETGAADIGIIAQSLALAPTMKDQGRFWLVPADFHPPLDQGGVILTWAKDRVACDRFRDFMMSEAGQAILQRYGFDSPK